VNKPDTGGTPPLCYAAASGRVEAVRLLLDAGAQVNAKGMGGKTALMGGAQQGYKEVVDALLAAKADVKAKDDFQATALHLTAPWGHVEVVEALVKAGADVNAEDRNKATPLMLARSRQQTEVADLLLQNGAKEPVAIGRGMGPYDDYGPGYNPATAQGPGVVAARATAVEVQIDPNAIREQVKEFEGLALAIQAVDDKSGTEQKGWVQRRTDNRVTLVRSVEKQFGDELVFVKAVAIEEKATKTIQVIDDVSAMRKRRYAAIADGLREERRAAMEQNADTMGMGRGRATMRGSRTRAGGASTQGGADPYGNNRGRMSSNSRRPEPNEPPMDADTQAQIQAWLNGRPESKPDLLEAVHRLDLAELDALRTVATEEEAKRTAAAISGVMLARDQRVQKISKEWQADDERTQRLQERMGTQDGMTRGRGTRGATPGQDAQTGAGRGRRYR
jgi:hypothetical protein